MVRLCVSLDAASVRAAQDLLDAFRFLIPATRLEPGCIGCSVWKEPNATVHYTEEWRLKRRCASGYSRTRSRCCWRSSNPCSTRRVQFHFVTATRGLDYLAEVRGQNSGL